MPHTMDLKPYIRDISDFPKPGIIYKDITPLLNDSSAMAEALRLFLEKLGSERIDKVVGIESRGFIFGALLAERLKAGFVPIRKPGKLPFGTIEEDYALEYGTNTLHLHRDAIKTGERVLVHDDVLATGGTAAAACKLVERLGGEVVQVNFLMELEFLNGKEKLKPHQVISLCAF